MHRTFLKIAAIFGGLGVIVGAFGAHFLKKYISPDLMTSYHTGVNYQFFHVFALIVVGLLYKRYPNKWIIWSGRFFIAGIILFSGSLYIIPIAKTINEEGIDYLGAITPLGGLSFIAGWTSLALGVPKAIHKDSD
ncbi:MAG: DUF423 domain-containing protein [Chitinophagaceae bacterium]